MGTNRPGYRRAATSTGSSHQSIGSKRRLLVGGAPKEPESGNLGPDPSIPCYRRNDPFTRGMKNYRIEPYLDGSIVAFIISPDFCKDLLLDTDGREASPLDRSPEMSHHNSL